MAKSIIRVGNSYINIQFITRTVVIPSQMWIGEDREQPRLWIYFYNNPMMEILEKYAQASGYTSVEDLQNKINQTIDEFSQS